MKSEKTELKIERGGGGGREEKRERNSREGEIERESEVES